MSHRWDPSVAREAFEPDSRDMRGEVEKRLRKERDRMNKESKKFKRATNRELIAARRLDTLLRDNHLHPYLYDITPTADVLNGRRTFRTIANGRRRNRNGSLSRANAWMVQNRRDGSNPRTEARRNAAINGTVSEIFERHIRQGSPLPTLRNSAGAYRPPILPTRGPTNNIFASPITTRTNARSERPRDPRRRNAKEQIQRKMRQFYKRQLIERLDFQVRHVIHNCHLTQREDNLGNSEQEQHACVPPNFLNLDEQLAPSSDGN